uniref:CPG4 domain-containing protein n=1 Tax=Strongyloides stercoralis TaxID=6248 RepID=A0A913I3W4_STRER
MKTFNCYIISILIFIFFIKIIISLEENSYLYNSTKCEKSPNDAKNGICLRPLINLWESIKSTELHASDILFPVPFYKAESLVMLCRHYTKSKEDCFNEKIHPKSCSSTRFKQFFQSHLEYFCGKEEGIKYWSEFGCLRSLLIESKENNNVNINTCFNLINQMQLKSNKDKCKNMEQFMKCIGKHVKMKCGIHTLKLLSDAIKNFGCLKNDKIIYKRTTYQNYGTSRNVKGDNDMILKYIQLYTNTTTSTSIIDFKTHNIIKKYLSSRISTGSLKLEKKNYGNNVKLTSPKKYNKVEVCNEEREKKLVQCYTPLMLRWDQIEEEKFSNKSVEKYHFFPMLKNNLHEIAELCDILNVIIDECLTTPVIQECLSNENLVFIDQELGQTCTYFHKNSFNSDFVCMKNVILKKPKCHSIIVGRNLPGLNPLIKCKQQTIFYECIYDDIKNNCGDKSLRILDDTIFNYGCKHPKEKLFGITKDESLNIINNNKHLSLDVGYKIDNSFILTKYGESIKRGNIFHYKISDDCTHYNLMISRSCTSNITKELRNIIVNAKNPISLSIFLLSSEELLNMCDNYANIFLCGGLENVLSCMDDINIRYIRDNFAYPCKPNKISQFLKAFTCIKNIIDQNQRNCKKFIIGRFLPSEDQRKCKGIIQFYDCISKDVKKYCGDNGKHQLWQYIHEYGCL